MGREVLHEGFSFLVRNSVEGDALGGGVVGKNTVTPST